MDDNVQDSHGRLYRKIKERSRCRWPSIKVTIKSNFEKWAKQRGEN